MTDPRFYDYDEETGVLSWNGRWSEPSPVDGVCLGQYLEWLDCIARAERLDPWDIIAINEAQVRKAADGSEVWGAPVERAAPRGAGPAGEGGQ